MGALSIGLGGTGRHSLVDFPLRGVDRTAVDGPWSGPAFPWAPLPPALGSPDARSVGSLPFGCSPDPPFLRPSFGRARVRCVLRGGREGPLGGARNDGAVARGPLHPPGLGGVSLCLMPSGSGLVCPRPAPQASVSPGGISARAGLYWACANVPSFEAVFLRPLSWSSAAPLRARVCRARGTWCLSASSSFWCGLGPALAPSVLGSI